MITDPPDDAETERGFLAMATRNHRNRKTAARPVFDTFAARAGRRTRATTPRAGG